MAFEDPNTPGARETPAGSTPDGGNGTADGNGASGSTPDGGNGTADENGASGSTPNGGNGAGAPASGVPAERRGIAVRRAPRFVPFMVLGGVVGIIAAAIVAYGLPGDPSFDAGAVFGFFLVTFAAGGVILGSVVALVLDRLSVRRAQRAVVESVPDNTPDDSES